MDQPSIDTELGDIVVQTMIQVLGVAVVEALTQDPTVINILIADRASEQLKRPITKSDVQDVRRDMNLVFEHIEQRLLANELRERDREIAKQKREIVKLKKRIGIKGKRGRKPKASSEGLVAAR